MSDWQRMTREQLEKALTALGERRGNRQATPQLRQADTVGQRVCLDVMRRVQALGEAKIYNVRIKTINGRAAVDVHLAGEEAGYVERGQYNTLRVGGLSHQEAVDTMVGALDIPKDHVVPAVSTGHFARITVPLMPGGRIYSQHKDLGRHDNPNEAEDLVEEPIEPLWVGAEV